MTSVRIRNEKSNIAPATLRQENQWLNSLIMMINLHARLPGNRCLDRAPLMATCLISPKATTNCVDEPIPNAYSIASGIAYTGSISRSLTIVALCGQLANSMKYCK